MKKLILPSIIIIFIAIVSFHAPIYVHAATPAATSSGTGLIPCDTNCDFSSAIQLLNNLQNFFFTTLLLPIFVIMVMYLGYSYLTAGGNPSQHAKFASMAKHMVTGLLLILCAWLIVHTLLSMLGYNDPLKFFGN